MFSAVINPPQAGILAVGAGIERIVPIPGAAPDSKTKFKAVTVVTVQLSADRRVISEAIASRFLQVILKVQLLLINL